MAKARYQVIRDYITDKVKDGTFAPQSQIPTELELSEQFCVSRMTVNKAIRDLVNQGVLVRFAGQGTYVTDLKVQSPLLEIKNIAQEIKERGKSHKSEVLSHSEMLATDYVALQLGVRVGTPVYYSLLIHFEDNAPLQLEERYVLPELAPDYLKQDFTATTPNEYLTSACPLSDIEHVVEAVLPQDYEAEHLGIKPGEPCILVNRRTWSNSRLVSCSRLLHPGSKFKLRSQMHL